MPKYLFALIILLMTTSSCKNDEYEFFEYPVKYIESSEIPAISKSLMTYLCYEEGYCYLQLKTNRIQENQTINTIKCVYEKGIHQKGVYRFIFLLSPDNWTDPQPYCSREINFAVKGLPKGMINIAVSINYGEIPLSEYSLAIGNQ